MKILLFRGLSIALFALCAIAVPAQTIAFVGVNVIPMDRERVIADQTVVVSTGRIKEIGDSAKVKVPKGAEKVDLKGMYVIPSMWDMHAHPADDVVLEKLFRWGVTGIRVPGVLGEAKVNFILASRDPGDTWKSGIRTGGFIHNGKGCEVPEHRSVDTREELREAIDFQLKHKIGFFKIHNCFPAGLVDDLAAAAKKHSFKIIGHIPQGIDPIDYVGRGISSVEHLDIILRALSFRESEPAKSIAEAVKILDGEYLDQLAAAMVKNRVALTPTLVTYENYVNTLPEQQRGLGNAVLAKLKKYNKRLFDRGVLLLAGTDTGLPGLEPGLALHRELELLVESGLTPYQALASATVNPARYLELSHAPLSLGSDGTFVVLRSNPLENIKNVGSIAMVVKNGKLKTEKR